MMTKIVECVPNFSEARRPEVVAQIRSAIMAIEGVTFLDQHSDTDHNRTVLTFVGEPEPVEQAAFAAIAKAAELIDLDQHTGQHPRLGATDVVLGVQERPLSPTAAPDFFRDGTIIDPTDIHRYHFWSLHPGGANWALTDGSVRFIGYDAGGPANATAPTVVEALATRAGGEVAPGF